MMLSFLLATSFVLDQRLAVDVVVECLGEGLESRQFHLVKYRVGFDMADSPPAASPLAVGWTIFGVFGKSVVVRKEPNYTVSLPLLLDCQTGEMRALDVVTALGWFEWISGNQDRFAVTTDKSVTLFQRGLINVDLVPDRVPNLGEIWEVPFGATLHFSPSGRKLAFAFNSRLRRMRDYSGDAYPDTVVHDRQTKRSRLVSEGVPCGWRTEDEVVVLDDKHNVRIVSCDGKRERTRLRDVDSVACGGGFLFAQSSGRIEVYDSKTLRRIGALPCRESGAFVVLPQ